MVMSYCFSWRNSSFFMMSFHWKELFCSGSLMGTRTNSSAKRSSIFAPFLLNASAAPKYTSSNTEKRSPKGRHGSVRVWSLPAAWMTSGAAAGDSAVMRIPAGEKLSSPRISLTSQQSQPLRIPETSVFPQGSWEASFLIHRVPLSMTALLRFSSFSSSPLT